MLLFYWFHYAYILTFPFHSYYQTLTLQQKNVGDCFLSKHLVYIVLEDTYFHWHICQKILDFASKIGYIPTKYAFIYTNYGPASFVQLLSKIRYVENLRVRPEDHWWLLTIQFRINVHNVIKYVCSLWCAFLFLFCNLLRLSRRAQGHSTAGRITSIEKSNHLIGNWTRDLPACSILPQPTTLPRLWGRLVL
jgi:hypothetical protein